MCIFADKMAPKLCIMSFVLFFFTLYQYPVIYFSCFNIFLTSLEAVPAREKFPPSML